MRPFMMRRKSISIEMNVKSLRVDYFELPLLDCVPNLKKADSRLYPLTGLSNFASGVCDEEIFDYNLAQRFL